MIWWINLPNIYLNTDIFNVFLSIFRILDAPQLVDDRVGVWDTAEDIGGAAAVWRGLVLLGPGLDTRDGAELAQHELHLGPGVGEAAEAEGGPRHQQQWGQVVMHPQDVVSRARFRDQGDISI